MIHSKLFSIDRGNSCQAFAMAILISLALTPQRSLAQARGSFQDGEGAVEFDSGPATPAVPGQVSSQSTGDSPPVKRNFQPRTGRRAAEKYMGQTPSTQDANSDSESAHRTRETRISSGDEMHFLAVDVGLFVGDTAYKWGSDKSNRAGNYTVGVTYRLGEWINSVDLNARVDFSEYSLLEGISSKISFLPVITFPDVKSRFPLYFGVGAGLGVFLHQVNDDSALAFEYQVIGGLRFFDVLPNTGFFVEGGIKNHVLILSEGQFNGPFVALGSLFLF